MTFRLSSFLSPLLAATFLFATSIATCGQRSSAPVAPKAALATSPPMGWNSWNWFGKNQINETLIREVIDAMATQGLSNAGYRYLVVDGGWRDTVLGARGELLADPVKFPHGMKALADYAHTRGLLFGLHTVPGTNDCHGDKVGGYGHEEVQIQQFIDWGVDFIKLDLCRFQGGWNESLIKEVYTKWGRILKEKRSNIVLSISAYTFRDWNPQVGQMSRTTEDIAAAVAGLSGWHAQFDDSIPAAVNKWNLQTVMQVAETNNLSAKYAGNGFWNDPDMLTTGDPGMSFEEQRMHFALWCVMSAPLMLGNDPRKMTEAEKSIVLNKAAIAIDQDPTAQGARIAQNGSTEIWAKKLQTGDRAVLFINRDKTAAHNADLSLQDIGLGVAAQAQDVYAGRSLGAVSRSFHTTLAPRSGLFVLFTASGGTASSSTPPAAVRLTNGPLTASIDPASMQTALLARGIPFTVSDPVERRTVTNLVQESTRASWTLAGSIAVSASLEKDFLDITFHSEDTGHFLWPVTQEQHTALTIPFYQGKYIPTDDPKWAAYLTAHSPFSGSQDLSMQFFARNLKDSALVYVIKNMFNNELRFSMTKGLELAFRHEFPATLKNKEYGFRIYLAANQPAAIAATYRSYVQEQAKIVSLEEKAAANANIRKLYGAPYIYMWNTEFLVPSDIHDWKQFKNLLVAQRQAGAPNPTKQLFALFGKKEAEYGHEFLQQWNAFKSTQWVIKYHKDLLMHALNEALASRDLYDADAWKGIALGTEAKQLLQKADRLEIQESYRLNELLLKSAFGALLPEVDDWGGIPLSMLDDMKASGITHAWLGLSDWPAAEKHSAFIDKALAEGYLIGPYDSYHSMHPPGKARWLTAGFTDTTLYWKAYVMNKDGKPASGFLGAGRKLNPILSMPAVRERVTTVMHENANRFNSWFIDCDGTGEVLDDYSPAHTSSQAEDIVYRLKRMSWIRDTFQLVIGSEVGNDFAASTIAFGHGMTTPIIEWSDPDMRQNKSSPYYIGGYFSSDGGIPSRYALQAPLKAAYAYTYFDNRFNVPLFQLVYNNVEITSNHWECGTLKYPDQIRNRELKDILYNVPPLYHLDEASWTKFKSIIVPHVKAFAAVHQKAVVQQMTGFEWVTADRIVQKTIFGRTLEIVANFGQQPYKYNDKPIAAQSLLIHDLVTGKYTTYTP